MTSLVHIDDVSRKRFIIFIIIIIIIIIIDNIVIEWKWFQYY